jgi:hypothetical protein
VTSAASRSSVGRSAHCRSSRNTTSGRSVLARASTSRPRATWSWLRSSVPLSPGHSGCGPTSSVISSTRSTSTRPASPTRSTTRARRPASGSAIVRRTRSRSAGTRPWYGAPRSNWSNLPDTNRAAAPSCDRSSSTSAVLPTPDHPDTTTSRERPEPTTWSQAARSARSSRSRPCSRSDTRNTGDARRVAPTTPLVAAASNVAASSRAVAGRTSASRCSARSNQPSSVDGSEGSTVVTRS